MNKFRRRPYAFILSVLLATILASIFSTQFVLFDLLNAGAPVDFKTRMSMTGYDALHLGPLYSIFISIGLLVAFLAAGFTYRKAQIKRPLIYTIAGMACFIVMLYLMKAVFFGVPIIAGARSGLGLAFQALAGGVAGYVFARLTSPQPEEEEEQ